MPITYSGIAFDPVQHHCDYNRQNLTPRGAHILDRRDLYYKDASSDKVYIVVTSQKQQGVPEYYIDAFYGRRGANLQHQAKSVSKDLSATMNVASKLVQEKKTKGYVDWVQGAPNTVRGQQAQSANITYPGVFPPINLRHPEYIQPGSAGGTRITVNTIMDETMYILEDALTGPRVYLEIPNSQGSPVTIRVQDMQGNLSDVSVLLPNIVGFGRLVSFNKNFVLDGHLMHPDKTRCDPQSIWNILTKGTPLERDELYLAVIDLPFYAGGDMTNAEWKDRRTLLTGLFTDIRIAINDTGWNFYDDHDAHKIVLHKYAYLKKEEFVIGKTELVAKHLRGKYKALNPGQTFEAKDRWFRWKVGAKRGSESK